MCVIFWGVFLASLRERIVYLAPGMCDLAADCIPNIWLVINMEKKVVLPSFCGPFLEIRIWRWRVCSL